MQSPLTGTVLNLSDLKAPAFSGGDMGFGLAIEPSLVELRSPVNGKVGVVFPTKHVVVIQAENGAEIKRKRQGTAVFFIT